MRVLGDLIPPKLTTAERNALPLVTGRVIYNTTTNILEFFNGSTWVETTGGAGGGLTFADVWAINSINNC